MFREGGLLIFELEKNVFNLMHCDIWYMLKLKTLKGKMRLSPTLGEDMFSIFKGRSVCVYFFLSLKKLFS